MAHINIHACIRACKCTHACIYICIRGPARLINWTRCPINEPSLVQLIYLAFSTMLGVLGHMSTPFSTYVLCVVECPINLHSFLAFRMGGPAKKQACEGGHVQLIYQCFMVWINWTRRLINWTRCPIN